MKTNAVYFAHLPPGVVPATLLMTHSGGKHRPQSDSLGKPGVPRPTCGGKRGLKSLCVNTQQRKGVRAAILPPKLACVCTVASGPPTFRCTVWDFFKWLLSLLVETPCCHPDRFGNHTSKGLGVRLCRMGLSGTEAEFPAP